MNRSFAVQGLKGMLTGITASSIILGAMLPVALAGKTSSTVGGRKAIAVNGVVVSRPFTRVAKDAGTLTSYIGVWYLGQGVKAAGGNYSWDPTSKSFNITAPGVDANKIRIPGGVGSGDTTIEVNGLTVKKVNSFAGQDPAGNASNITTFMPLFYLSEIFGNLGGTNWNGSTFTFKTFIQSTTPANTVTQGSQQSVSTNGGSQQQPASTNNGAGQTPTSPKGNGILTLDDFQQIQIGMTYPQVANFIGKDGGSKHQARKAPSTCGTTEKAES